MNKELEKALKNAELTDEQISAVDKQMKEEKVFVTTEENIEERYSKAKTQKEALDTELKEANDLIADLKKNNASSEDLQTKIADYEKQVQDLQTENQAQAKQSAVDLAVVKYGAKNPRAVNALLDLEKIEVTEDGVKGVQEQLDGLKESDSYLFQDDNEQPQPTIVNEEDPNGSSGDDKDAFDEVVSRY